MLHPYPCLPSLLGADSCRRSVERTIISWAPEKARSQSTPPTPTIHRKSELSVWWWGENVRGMGKGKCLRTPLNVMKKQGGLRCTPTRCLPESLKQPIHPPFLPPTPQFSYPSPYFFLLLPAQFTEQYLCYLKKKILHHLGLCF